jgi:putative SOS response-associated peptidase YedK
MPAILPPEDYERWVFDDWESALKAVGPYPARVMTAVQLSQEINNSATTTRRCLPPACSS